MKKGMVMIPLIFSVFLLGALIIFSARFLFGGPEDSWICQDGQWVKHGNPSNAQPKTGCGIEGKNVTEATTNRYKISPASSVPLPSGHDIVRVFFELIGEKKIPEAVLMMSKSATGADNQKQAWGVQFNAFETISVESISDFEKESWTDQKEEYKVSLKVTMKPEAENNPIPNYGYENGENIRWVTLTKEKNIWKVDSIGTGP